MSPEDGRYLAFGSLRGCLEFTKAFWAAFEDFEECLPTLHEHIEHSLRYERTYFLQKRLSFLSIILFHSVCFVAVLACHREPLFLAFANHTLLDRNVRKTTRRKEENQGEVQCKSFEHQARSSDVDSQARREKLNFLFKEVVYQCSTLRDMLHARHCCFVGILFIGPKLACLVEWIWLSSPESVLSLFVTQHATRRRPRSPDSPCMPCLITHSNQVSAEFLDRVGCGAGLYCLGVMCDEEGLFCLDDHDAFSALLPIQTSIICLNHNILLPRDVQPRTLHLLRLAVVLVRAGDFLHFLRGDVEVCGCGPDGGAFGVEDGGFVDVAGADEAGVDVCLPRHLFELVLIAQGERKTTEKTQRANQRMSIESRPMAIRRRY